MKFNYFKLYQDLKSTFVFEDSYAAKAKEIGIKYTDLVRMRQGKPVPIEIILKCFNYLAKSEVFDIGSMFASYIQADPSIKKDADESE